MNADQKPKLEIKVIPTFLGNCLIIKDVKAGKDIEVMQLQLKAIIMSGNDQGSLPHADWEKDGDTFTIYHNGERGSKHDVSFTLNELNQALEFPLL